MKYKIFDAHCDTLCLLNDEKKSIDENTFHVDKRRMERYESYTQTFACFIDPVYKNCAMERFIALCDTFYTQNTGGILSVEGAEMITSLKELRTLKRLGVKIIALTWNYSNHIASGALEKNKDRGLTEFGKSVVAEMNRLDILLDVSHLNDRSFFDAADITVHPILATHSDSRAVCSHPRNLTDDQFKRIIESGGCVGINFYPDFLSNNGNATIDDIIRHIEHFMALGGEDCIGIGADFDGVYHLPDGICGCQDTYKIFDRLLRLNYSEKQIEKISHENFERIINQTNSERNGC